SHNGKARNDYERKLDIVSNNLYGVDLDKFAINTAMLRLWLSLIVDYRDEETLDRLPPLPNLDFKIEHGDSLSALDPQKLSDLFKHELIDNADALQNKKALFFREASEKKEALKKEIIAEQNRLIIALQDSASPKDSFEWRVQFAEVFKPTAADVTLSGATNFGRELAEANVPGGFHIVIANPPYGLKVSDALRDRYFPKKEGAQSKDTYGLFMARALELLCDGGQFCFIVSDTWRTITSHRPLRKRLMEQTIVHHVIDLPSWVFKATVNTGIVTLTKAKPDAKTVIIAGDLGGLEDRDWHTLENNLRIMAARGIDVQTPQYARYTYKQSLIGTYDNLSFFIASPKLYGLMIPTQTGRGARQLRPARRNKTTYGTRNSRTYGGRKEEWSRPHDAWRQAFCPLRQRRRERCRRRMVAQLLRADRLLYRLV
ncbi:MAG: N-6 DNA methylase, partial [Armatimonadetes bacterium]|nr:N-6 DNA methylase [Armatimonadota bacterium]